MDYTQELKRLEVEEQKIRKERETYKKSKCFCYGDALHVKLNKALDENIKAQNKLTKKALQDF